MIVVGGELEKLKMMDLGCNHSYLSYKWGDHLGELESIKGSLKWLYGFRVGEGFAREILEAKSEVFHGLRIAT